MQYTSVLKISLVPNLILFHRKMTFVYENIIQILRILPLFWKAEWNAILHHAPQITFILFLHCFKLSMPCFLFGAELY